MKRRKKRFRVAFSFAGKKRDYVGRMAAVLADFFGRSAILYDRYHEAEFARSDLGFYLPPLYRKQSDLIVVVLCPDYEANEWCGLEWNAIFDLLKSRRHEEVMLLRFGHASVKGLYSTAGFVELDEKTPEETTVLILKRLQSIHPGLAAAPRVLPSEVFPSDPHCDFKIPDDSSTYNPIPLCAQLICGYDDGSTYRHFYLMPTLLCGTERQEQDNVWVDFGVSQVELRLKLRGCIIHRVRVGGRDHPFIRAKAGNRWIIEGPRERFALKHSGVVATLVTHIHAFLAAFLTGPGDQSVLSGQVIGDNILCDINAQDEKMYNIIIEVWCPQLNIIYSFTPKDGIYNAWRGISRKKEIIIETFINNKRLKAELGFVKLCSANFDVEARNVE